MNKLKKFPEKLQGILSNKSQELIIFPTEQCNFRCTYCYEDFALGKMSNELVGGVKKLLYRRIPELDFLHLSWFGGEPLVAKDIVFDISEYASSLTKKHSTNYVGSMTTNGYNLTLKTFSKLVDFGITNYQISLDGSRNIHNTTRIRADGKGTFDRIWRNLLDISKSDLNFSITLRVHLDSNNVDQIESFLKNLKKEFFYDKRFSFFLKPIEKLGGKNDENLHIIPIKERKFIIDTLKENLFGDNSNKTNNEPYICYASKPNSLIIRSDGRIGKCTVALNDKRNSIGELLSNGTINIDSDLLAPWLQGITNLDLNALSCPLQSLPNNPV